jgi:hypothetical protein
MNGGVFKGSLAFRIRLSDCRVAGVPPPDSGPAASKQQTSFTVIYYRMTWRNTRTRLLY